MAWSLAHGFCHIPPATSGDGDERVGMMMNSTNSMMNGVRQIPRNQPPTCAHAPQRSRGKEVGQLVAVHNERAWLSVVARANLWPRDSTAPGREGRWERGGTISGGEAQPRVALLHEKPRLNSYVACMQAGEP
jgi:hypothetical protein